MSRLGHVTGNEHFALDLHRNFLKTFGVSVLGVRAGEYDNFVSSLMSKRQLSHQSDLDVSDLTDIVNHFKSLADVPTDPWKQMQLAIVAVFKSWDSPSARLYRKTHNIIDSIGASVIVQTMVYGNINASCGSGFCFTRSPSSGDNMLVGDYLCSVEGNLLRFFLWL